MKDQSFISMMNFTDKTARVEDFRKTFYPIPFINSATVFLGAGGVGCHLWYNYTVKKPWFASMHKTFAIACVCTWIGYYATRFAYQYKMGKFKYALDYIERHKEDFPDKKLKTYGSPSWLVPWRPIR